MDAVAIRSAIRRVVWGACAVGALFVCIAFVGGTQVAAAAPPEISGEAPNGVSSDAATITAMIDANGVDTSFHLEYGPTTGYGSRVPVAGELPAGTALEPIAVSAAIEGLAPGTVYHYRLIAANADGTTIGRDRQFSTLNSEGLAWERRFELVSPLDKGATGQAGQPIVFGGIEMQYQAATDGDALAYTLAYGIPGSTYGGEIAYRGDRGSSGWSANQVSPSLVGQPPAGQNESGNSYGKFNAWLSNDLECAVGWSSVALTDDPVAKAAVDLGGFNLYRRNADGTYDLISNLAPTSVGGVFSSQSAAYQGIQASEDCSRVIFEVQAKYPGVPFTTGGEGGFGSDIWGLYEWKDGLLGNPSAIPGSSAPEYPTAAQPGSSKSGNPAYWHSLSEDGSRFYFTSTGAGTSNPVGREAIFLAEEGEATKDISVSQTATANNGPSRYQMATSDGSEVFFIARYGLAPNASSTGATACTVASGNNLGVGCDLYRYSADTGVLTDLSASTNPADTAGAGVAGVLDVSADGSRVYFAAKGQLVAGKGQTYAQNTTAATRGYNLYYWDAGTLSYVATVAQVDVNTNGLLATGNRWASKTTPDGSALIFQSNANITGPTGVLQAYRYTAEDGVECVSCRRDGGPQLGTAPPLRPLLEVAQGGSSYPHPMPTLSDDGETVFFNSGEPLTAGTTPGSYNLFEWREGQVALLVAELPGLEQADRTSFKGASQDGRTVFFATRAGLVPWDTDGRSDVYAARVGGGGFPPPPTPKQPCNSLSEASCLGIPEATPPPASAGSSDVTGPGNVKEKACRVNQVRRQGRCVSKKSIARERCAKREGKAKQRCIRKQVQTLSRNANTNRRTGK